MIKTSTIYFTFFAFILFFSQQRKVSFLPDKIFGEPSRHGIFKIQKSRNEKNKFSTFYIEHYKKLPIKRVPDELIKSDARQQIIDVQQSLNYLNQNYRNDDVIFDHELGNKIAEIKKIDKDWDIDHYFQEFYFYEYSIQKREQEKIWNINFIASRRKDSLRKEKRIRMLDSIRLVNSQKNETKTLSKNMAIKK